MVENNIDTSRKQSNSNKTYIQLVQTDKQNHNIDSICRCNNNDFEANASRKYIKQINDER